MWRSTRVRRISVIVGAVALVLAAAWEALAIPALVKYPTDLDATLHLGGTFTSLMDPNTGATMANPMHLSLAVDQRVQSQAKGSGAHKALVKETIDQRIGGQLIHVSQVNYYVMDRRSLKNVQDARANSGTPANVLNRAGAYRVNLPFGLSPGGTYRMYENDIGGTFLLKPDKQRPTEKVNGLKLARFVGGFDYTPITATHYRELNAVMPMPKTLTLQQLAPALKKAGVDLGATISALSPFLSPADRAALLKMLSQPVTMQYVEQSSGGAAVDQSTGAIVDLQANVKLAARPVLSGLSALDQLLARHATVPQAVTARTNLAKAQTSVLLPVFEYSYTPIPKLWPPVTSKVKDMKTQLALAQRTVPLGLVALAALGFVLGGLSWAGGRRGRPTDVAAPEPAPASVTVPEPEPELEQVPEPEPEPEPVAVGPSLDRRVHDRRDHDRRRDERRDHERRAVA